MKQTITIGYGKSVFPESSGTIAGFVVEAPFVRTLASKKLARVQGTIRTPVSHNPDIDGWLFNDTIEAEDGTIFLLQVSHKYRGSAIRDGAMFLRTRRDAASLVITASIPPNHRSILPSSAHQAFVGKADILTAEDLARFGITPNDNYISAFMDPEEVGECFTVHVLQPAINPMPQEEQHVTPEGTVVNIRIPNRARRMRIRK